MNGNGSIYLCLKQKKGDEAARLITDEIIQLQADYLLKECTINAIGIAGVKLFIHPSHNAPGAVNSKERLDEALDEYKRRIAGV